MREQFKEQVLHQHLINLLKYEQDLRKREQPLH